MSQAKVKYGLLTAFENLFKGTRYLHRISTHGDKVSLYFYEDLSLLGRSAKLKERVASERCGVNTGNVVHGKKSRRGDGTFGEMVPNLPVAYDAGFTVPRGKLAITEIGIEVKILAKAMIKQIDRVSHDLTGQVEHFRKANSAAITVGVVGVNYAEKYTSYEGDRIWPTTGQSGHKHPIQEAAEAERRLDLDAKPSFNEFLYLRFKASNVEPYPFEWLNAQKTYEDYGAILARVSRLYDQRMV